LGEVHVAEDTEIGREVALKRIRMDRRHDTEARRRFLREAAITGRLEHPGIVPVYGLTQGTDGQPCYAMRFIRGVTFLDAIRRYHEADPSAKHDTGERRIAFRHLLSQFVSACQTMAYAHSHGIIHRDLKPSNIMLGKYGETLVVDWGLARPIASTEPHDADEASVVAMTPDDDSDTKTGTALGTPAYMSPEQARGDWANVGPASDVYSLGATLYVVLTGKAPFHDAKSRHTEMAPTPPSRLNPKVPRALEAVCLKAMAPYPQGRYQSATALAEDVEAWLADEPVTAHRDSLLIRGGP
jgi:serine/threonine protein kinase